MTARFFLAALLCVLAGSVPAPSAEDASLTRLVTQARAQAIHPRATPPKWMDWAQVSRALTFYEKHGKPIDGILATSSLVATYAAVDISPVLMRTGRLARDYNQRIRETGAWVDSLLKTPPSEAAFLADNYSRAVELGKLHASLAATMTPEQLGWNPAERVPMNQQAYALVLYSFAWQPVEALTAMHELDATADAADLEAWCHLWSVFGYAMGVEEELLPRPYARAREIVPLLRARQYASKSAEIPDSVPVLLRGELRMLMRASANSPAPEARRKAAQQLAGAVSLSPGLGQALGLSDHPVDDLVKLLE